MVKLRAVKLTRWANLFTILDRWTHRLEEFFAVPTGRG